MLESLEPRTFFSVNTSTVALYAPDGSPATLQKHEPLWIIIHGLDSDKNDPSNQSLAQAVQQQEPNAQSLILDWGALATPPDNATAYINADAVGDKIANLLRRSRIPASRVNMIGFSMGGQIEDRIAKDLQTPTSEVNCIVALDPAAPNASGHRYVPSFSAHATHSIAFLSVQYAPASESAADTVILTGTIGSSVQKHVETAYFFTNMMRRDAGLDSSAGDNISPIFSLANLSTGNLPAWTKNAYHPNSEAILNATPLNPGNGFLLEPTSLTYVNRRGHRVQI
jgi:hypothetical protein